MAGRAASRRVPAQGARGRGTLRRATGAARLGPVLLGGACSWASRFLSAFGVLTCWEVLLWVAHVEVFFMSKFMDALRFLRETLFVSATAVDVSSGNDIDLFGSRRQRLNDLQKADRERSYSEWRKLHPHL